MATGNETKTPTTETAEPRFYKRAKEKAARDAEKKMNPAKQDRLKRLGLMK